ncbi:MAG: efflux RND transporter periplasmic adaptor subunit [Acidobacteriota bacterium]
MKKVYLVLAVIFTVFYFTGCSGNDSQKNDTDKKDQEKTEVKKEKGKEEGKKNNNKKGKDKKDDTDTIPVSVQSPERGDINSFLLFSSNIDTDKMVDIYPMTSGIIEKIVHDEGDRVGKGTVLAVLDDREASINEQKAKITYEQQKAEFERQKEIFEKELISKEEYERLRFSYEQSRLDWQQKKLLLSYTRITSPISGLVSKRHIKTGNKINTNQLSFSVVYTKEKIAVVNIPEQEKDQIFLNQKAIISSGKKVLNGYIKRISPAIDPESGTFKTTIEVRDTENVMFIGQFVNVRIIKKVHKNVILVTKDVLMFEGDRVFVFTINEENIAFKKEVKTGFDDGSKVEVVKGLQISDKLVSAGKSSLKNESKVKIIEPII